MSNFQIDSTDRKILRLLQEDARMSFLEIGRKLNISGPAVHQRVQKLKEAGVIKGSTILIDARKIGYMTCAFIGVQVNLTSNTTHDEVFNKIKDIPEIVECHHITGKYSLLLKVNTFSNEHLKKIIVEKIQTVPEIISTETYISLEEGFLRSLPV